MEVLCKEPDLIKHIVSKVDDRTLINLKEAIQEISHILKEKKFFAIRILKGHKSNFIEFKDSWIKVLENNSKDAKGNM